VFLVVGWPVYGGFTSSEEFINGAQLDFIPFISFMLLKNINFAMLLATIPSFHGYYMKGARLEVGRASTVSLFEPLTIILSIIY
jgi:phospholipid/cholesterol/gamma-HCH transport system permease protein